MNSGPQEQSQASLPSRAKPYESRSLPSRPVLRFSPTAWAKLLFFRDRGDTEISGFGISDPDDLLYVREFITIKQQAGPVSISLDDEAVADFFDRRVDAGNQPEEFFRLWCHTHPGNSAQPSGTDEDTFRRVFGGCEWAVMFILARDGDRYARLRFSVGPGGDQVIPVEVDYGPEFGGSDHESWQEEYQENIQVVSSGFPGCPAWQEDDILALSSGRVTDYSLPGDILAQLEELDPAERQVVLDELAGRPELWPETDGEVMFYD